MVLHQEFIHKWMDIHMCNDHDTIHMGINNVNVKEKTMDDEYITGHSPTFKNPAQYLKVKLKILSRDFKITPTETELEHLRTLTTQISIDNAILSVIARHWG